MRISWSALAGCGTNSLVAPKSISKSDSGPKLMSHRSSRLIKRRRRFSQVQLPLVRSAVTTINSFRD